MTCTGTPQRQQLTIKLLLKAERRRQTIGLKITKGEEKMTAERVAYLTGKIIARFMIWGVLACALIFAANTIFDTGLEYSFTNISAVAICYAICRHLVSFLGRKK